MVTVQEHCVAEPTSTFNCPNTPGALPAIMFIVYSCNIVTNILLVMLPPEPGTSSAWQERRGSRSLPPVDNIQEVIYDDTVNRCLNICRVGTVGRH